MCTVDKMLIKGIRSFSPENTDVIAFFKPLTLIVGPNGAGKTTIIECLKHACTGELPPNARSGHSFIHDPKVAGETETKGQIKLRFKTAAGKDVVCIRSFQLTQKASKLEYKAIESVLQTIDHRTGEKVCLSYRCADMDREVPALMGVSKAILENVIFVHQDEANWPLAEGAILKKKFDDIFSATRYTKALEVIKKLHKEQAQLIKEYKLKLEHLQTLRDAAMRLQESIESDRGKSTHVQAQIGRLAQMIEGAQSKITELEDRTKGMRRLQAEIDVLNSKREVLAKQRDQQYADMESEADETDEGLERWRAEFETQLAEMKLRIAREERELSDARMQNKGEKERYNRDCQQQGRLQADREAYAKDKDTRDSVTEALFSKHNLGSLGMLPLPDDVADGARKTAEARISELEENLKELKEANSEEYDKLTAQVEAAGAKNTEIAVKLNHSRGQIDRNRQKLQDLSRQIRASTISDNDLRRIEEEEKSTREAADAIAAQIRERNFDESVNRLKSQQYSNNLNIQNLHREKDGLASESELRVKLKVNREALAEKEGAIQRLLEENKPQISKFLGGRRVDPGKLPQETEKVASANRKAYADLDTKAKNVGQEVAALTMKLNDARADLAAKTRGRDATMRNIKDRLFATFQAHMEAANLQEKLSAAKAELNKAKRNHDTREGMKSSFASFIKYAEEENACPACERDFQPAERDKFMKQQREFLKDSAEVIRQLLAAQLQAESKVKSLEQLLPVYHDYVKLSQEAVPAAEKAVADAGQALSKAMERHDDLLGLLAQTSMEHEGMQKLEAAARDVGRLHSEAEGLRGQVGDLEYKLDAMSQDARTMADVNAELAVLEDTREELERRLEKLRDEKDMLATEFNACNMRWRNARESKAEALQKVAKLKELEAERARVEAESRELDLQIQAAEHTMEPLRQEQEKLLAERGALKEQAQVSEDRLVSEIRVLQQDVGNLRTTYQRIEQYQLSGKEAKLGEITERLAASLAAQKRYEAQINELTDSIAKRREQVMRRVTVKRNIDDNIAYRKTCKEEATVMGEVESAQRRLIQMGDLREAEAELRSLGLEVQNWVAEQNRGRGTLAAYEANIKRNRGDLKAPQYKDVSERYRTQLIQLKTTEMANKDLDKYYNALDKALMRFHAMKMEEINKIIKELWQQTYRGQDIDFIEIRSDAEGGGTRSYSYRVVMRSGDAELDMRGRCSAGQKVLASLIIRLALAETFCLNCGILALDEPTTNLDLPNADSLAGALLRIMEERKGQENFQLIIITHDERFAQMIGQKEHAERYYRITKDDHQHSKINIQDIFE